nr:hypothetical protein [uncultured Ottowia sp.]
MSERKPWTTRELAWLRENAARLTVAQAAHDLGRTPSAVKAFARRYGVALQADAAPPARRKAEAAAPEALSEAQLDAVFVQSALPAGVLALRYGVRISRVYAARRAAREKRPQGAKRGRRAA